MAHTYKPGDIVRTRQDYLPAEHANMFAEVVEAKEDFCQVKFYLGQDNCTFEVIPVDDLAQYVEDIIVSSHIRALCVFDEDDSDIDWSQFCAGSCAAAVHSNMVTAFLELCDTADITWKDGVKASKFNPYAEMESFGPLIGLYCALCSMDLPSDYCIFSVVQAHLTFMFSRVISDCITESKQC